MPESHISKSAGQRPVFAQGTHVRDVASWADAGRRRAWPCTRAEGSPRSAQLLATKRAQNIGNGDPPSREIPEQRRRQALKPRSAHLRRARAASDGVRGPGSHGAHAPSGSPGGRPQHPPVPRPDRLQPGTQRRRPQPYMPLTHANCGPHQPRNCQQPPGAPPQPATMMVCVDPAGALIVSWPAGLSLLASLGE
jgi:hypothetical protein